jgi:tetratricopeptide (TPR) repeat protein
VALHGERHEDTAATLVRMGELAEMSGSYAEAVGFLNRALVVFEACLGFDHEETTKTALKLASIQSHQSDYYQQALTMYEQALEVRLELGWRAATLDFAAATCVPKARQDINFPVTSCNRSNWRTLAKITHPRL